MKPRKALGIVLMAMLFVVGCGNADPTLSGFTDTWTWNGQAWTDRSSGVHPDPRLDGAFVFDEARGVALLFGGQGLDGQMLDDTWTWDGRHWTRQTPKSHPPAGDGVAVYDSVRQVVWLIVGQMDTWKWDGQNWTQVMPKTSPPRLGWSSLEMAFNRASGRVVTIMYTKAGQGDVPEAETWTWDGTAWTRADATGGPGAAFGYMFDDPSAGRLVFLEIGSSDYRWSWDGTAWSKGVALPEDPRRHANSSHGVAYNSTAGILVLFGGYAASECPENGVTSLASDETWQWNGSAWRHISTVKAPPKRVRTLMTYDSVRQQIVMFGGSTRDLCPPVL
jgi:Galactose oxidase, central domain